MELQPEWPIQIPGDAAYLQFFSPHGERVIAWFGARGLVCYNLTGELQWTKALARFNIRRAGEAAVRRFFSTML